MAALKQHHAATLVAGCKVLAIVAELQRRDYIRCSMRLQMYGLKNGVFIALCVATTNRIILFFTIVGHFQYNINYDIEKI